MDRWTGPSRLDARAPKLHLEVGMYLMLAVRQGLAAVDAVMRACARRSRLERSEAMVLGLVATRPRRGASEIAVLTGQPRQHAQRCLKRLAARGLVEPVGTLRNKVVGWGLTSKGEVVWAELAERLGEYEALLGSRVALLELVESLERVVQVVVNRPRSTGWLRGLVVPYSMKLP